MSKLQDSKMEKIRNDHCKIQCKVLYNLHRVLCCLLTCSCWAAPSGRGPARLGHHVVSRADHHDAVLIVRVLARRLVHLSMWEEHSDLH